MAKVIKNNLGYLGVDFQYKLISAFMEDQGFFRDLESVIDQNMFTEAYLRTIVGVLKEYFNKHAYLPSYEMLLIKLNDVAYSEDEQQYYKEAVEALQKQPSFERDEIEELAEKFFKQQNWIRVSNEIKRVAGDGDISKFDELMELINKANSVGRRNVNFFNPFDNMDDNLTPSSTTYIPTGIEKLDNILGGGLEKGKLGAIIAPSGVGKTSLTTGISAYAAAFKHQSNDYEGFKVLQIVFEDTKRDLSRKYYGRFTQVETCNIDSRLEEVRSLLDNYPDKDAIINNVRCVRMVSGETKAKDIRNTIEQMILTGWVPDLVIIDYFECVEVEGRSGENEWKREAKTMRKFETMAQELNIGIWIPIQGGKESINSELITMDKASGAVQKIQIPQVVMSISRPYDADGNTNKAVIALLKHRGGKLGSTMHVDFNNGTCTITYDNSISFDSALAYNEESVKYDTERKKEMVQSLRRKN